jgi:dihydromonapterin reductase / dihydrofolate reductase
VKSILITGASRRLGLFLSEEFLRMGFYVYAVTRTCSTELNNLAEANSNLQLVLVEGYDHPSGVQLSKALGGASIDVIVNNASYYHSEKSLLSESGGEQYQAFFNVHMLFPALLSEWYYQQTKAENREGIIINLTDIFAEKPTASNALYCSTKAGLENLTRSLAKKFAPIIRVNSILPGPIKFLPSHSKEDKERVLNETLLGKEGGFSPIFQTICFIIDNHYLTGSAIKVDGGRSIY